MLLFETHCDRHSAVAFLTIRQPTTKQVPLDGIGKGHTLQCVYYVCFSLTVTKQCCRHICKNVVPCWCTKRAGIVTTIGLQCDAPVDGDKINSPLTHLPGKIIYCSLSVVKHLMILYMPSRKISSPYSLMGYWLVVLIRTLCCQSCASNISIEQHQFECRVIPRFMIWSVGLTKWSFKGCLKWTFFKCVFITPRNVQNLDIAMTNWEWKPPKLWWTFQI